MSLRNYAIRRILFSFPIFLGISVILFGLMMLAPQDYADVVRAGNPTMTQDEVDNLRLSLGLDRPAHEQYVFWLLGRSSNSRIDLNYLKELSQFVINIPITLIDDFFNLNLNIIDSGFTEGFVFGNMGQSFTGSRINDMIGDLTWETVKLALAALIMSLLIGIPLGIFSARNPYSKLDSVGTILALFGVSMPVFWTGIMTILLFSDMKIIFGIKIPSIGAHSYKLTGYEGPLELFVDEIAHMLLPTLVLGLAGTALILRLTRSSMLEVLKKDYILTARSKGLSERLVIYKHALRNALLPVVTIVGLTIGTLLAGSALTETVFAWPGLGREAVARVQLRDYNFMMGINMLVAIFVVLGNLATDIAYAFLDPRIRF